MIVLYEQVAGKRSHDFTGVRFDNAGQQGHRAGNGLFAQKAENAQLGQPSVVDFGLQTLGFLFGGFVLGQIERVEIVKGHGVGDVALEWGKVPRFAPFRVVGTVPVHVHFRKKFQKANKEDDLDLGRKR